MVGPVRFDGPVSGIDYTSIIQKLLELHRRPINTLQTRIDGATERKNALLEVNISLLAFKGTADTLSKPSFFASNKVSSSNESSLTATATASTPIGSYTFTPRRLAQSHQLISNGFADSTVTPVTTAAGSLTVEIGGGFLDRQTTVASLNGQTGFDRGSIRVTDSAGRTGLIDLSGAVTVKDLLDEINGTTSVSVRASVTGNRLTIEDRAGGIGSLTIADAGSDLTATSLGIAGTGVSGFLYGSEINRVTAATSLSMLNDGLGVRRNLNGIADFTITDVDGTAIAVDLQSGDDTVQKVIDRINGAATTAGSGVVASLVGNALMLTDTAPTGAGAVSVSQAPDSFAAADLGLGTITGAAFVSNVAEDAAGDTAALQRTILVGGALAPSLNSIQRTLLNGGQTNLLAGDLKGVADGSIAITDRMGVSATIDLSRRVFNANLGGLVAGATSLQVQSGAVEGLAVGNRFRVSTSAGLEYRTVTDITGDVISFDGPLAGSVADGAAIYGLNDSLEDMIRTINDRAQAGGVGARVEVNPEGNGLRVVDLTAGAGTLTVAGAPAAELGIAGSSSAGVINGTDLDPQYLGETTLLASMNGGQGVAAGKLRIIDTNNRQFDIDLTQADDTTLGEVIKEINAAAVAFGSGVQARINDAGDGLLLIDATPGTGVLRVQELNNGRTARDLNIAGAAPSAAPDTINGSFERTISIAANSRLQDVADAINQAGLGVTAAVVNDGSGFTPYRLSLTSPKPGKAGRMTVDSTLTGLSFTTAVAAQDAVLLYGSGGGGGEPVVVTSSGNTVSGIVPGMTLSLKGAGGGPVTVTVSRDTEAVVEQVQRFVDSYNDVINKIRETASFNAETLTKGPLFGDPVIRRVRRDLPGMVLDPVVGISQADLNLLSEIGVKAGAEGTLTFDGGVLQSKLDTDFEDVERLFILQRPLETVTAIRDLNSGLGITDSTGDDFRILARDGLTILNVNVGGSSTLGSLLLGINATPGNNGVIQAQISPSGFSIDLVDNSVLPARTAAGATTATDFDASEADLLALADDRIVGSTITFTSGANAGEVRKVIAFDPITERITLDAALPSASYAGDGYRLERELEVQKVGTAPAASELKILKKMTLGLNVLRGDILGLDGDPGVAARISEELDFITRSGDGLIAIRTEGIDESVEDLEESIDKIEARIEQLQENLIRKFSRLESIIAQSQNTSQRLSLLLSGLLTGSNGRFSGF